jgi:hypothetical protein
VKPGIEKTRAVGPDGLYQPCFSVRIFQEANEGRLMAGRWLAGPDRVSGSFDESLLHDA